MGDTTLGDEINRNCGLMQTLNGIVLPARGILYWYVPVCVKDFLFLFSEEYVLLFCLLRKKMEIYRRPARA